LYAELPKRAQIDKAQRKYDILILGEDFRTPERNITPCTLEDSKYWKSKRKTHQRLLNRRFNSKYNDFEEYLMFRNEVNIEEEVYEAQNKYVAIRENPARVAKRNLLEKTIKE